VKITNPDITNTDPKFWEEVLESYGLGVRQLGLEEEETDESEELELEEGFNLVPLEEVDFE
jgi:hypothetical protein